MNFGGAVHPITFPYGLFLPAIILCWFSFDLWVSHWGGGGYHAGEKQRWKEIQHLKQEWAQANVRK